MLTKWTVCTLNESTTDPHPYLSWIWLMSSSVRSGLFISSSTSLNNLSTSSVAFITCFCIQYCLLYILIMSDILLLTIHSFLTAGALSLGKTLLNSSGSFFRSFRFSPPISEVHSYFFLLSADFQTSRETPIDRMVERRVCFPCDTGFPLFLACHKKGVESL